MFGYAPQAWYDDAELWSKIVHPEDRARLDAEPETDGATASSYRVIAERRARPCGSTTRRR